MLRGISVVFLTSMILFQAAFGVAFKTSVAHAASDGSLTSQESQVTALVNGTQAYDYNLELEKIALRHFAFRSAGSAGANETANWLRAQFQGFGLEAWLEPFNFTTWDLRAKPSLVLDLDGNESTTQDQIPIPSFQSQHVSWPTPSSGIFANVVTLPLPGAASRSEVGARSIDMGAWDAINTTGKIVLIGAEAQWSSSWLNTALNKMMSEPPAALIYTWWYNWMSFTPATYGSASARAFWAYELPLGAVSYQDGLRIRNLGNTPTLSGRVTIDSVIGNGTHYNVVGRIRGSTNPNKIIIISGHYDTVMTAGFMDNGGGTAGVVELARVFSDAARNGLYRPDYTLLFVAFAAEEFWLVGSINYVRQHKSELANITAVINLDCIGADGVSVSDTDLYGGLDLHQTMIRAAADLGVSATTESPGGSDHESFLDPASASNSFIRHWGVDPGISDALPVGASSMVISYPLFPTDKFSGGSPGWIHTSYDNSTSTQTLGWVKPVNLGLQIQIAGLSVMRVQEGPAAENPAYFPWEILVVVAVGVIAVVVVVYFVRARRRTVKDEEPSSSEPSLTR